MRTKSVYRFYYHTVRRAISQFFRPTKKENRSEEFVRQEYTENYDRESNNDFMFKRETAFLNGVVALYPVIEHKKFLLNTFAYKFSSFGPESVLELGSGRGFNILALAILCPSIKKLRGVELSPKGVLWAKENLKNPPLSILQHLTGVSRDEIKKRLALRDIDFIEGSIRALPFKDGEFDAVYSNSVIEQIPRDYSVVFSEASRVAKNVGIFSEPFREAQGGNLFFLLHLHNIDYFKASYVEVEKSGWKVFHYETSPLQKFHFRTGFLTCLKKAQPH